jgi:DNA-binding transcriptional MerR regulator/methylmalonyl-CoA mutase cobalamin-binding subunit
MSVTHRHGGYPVRTVARMTGLSTDIIRVWEKRYGVVDPARGPRGSRIYTTDDVAHLRLLARTVAAGRAIGDVAHLSRTQLDALLAEHESADATRAGGGTGRLLARLYAALDPVDIAAIDVALGEALVALGTIAFARDVAAPFLVEVGERWSMQRLSVADEHLISGVLRNVLSGLVRTHARPSTPTVLLTTPRGERHEFGVLLAALLLLDAGVGIHYLGVDLPAAEIVAAARRADVAAVGVGVVNGENRDEAVTELRMIERTLPSATELWVGGREAASVVAALGATRAVILDRMSLLEREAARLRVGRVAGHA